MKYRGDGRIALCYSPFAAPTFSHTHTNPPHRPTTMHSPYLGLFYFSAQYLALHDAFNEDGAAQNVQDEHRIP